MLFAALVANGQLNREIVKTELQPFVINGRQNPLNKNLSFAEYKTSKIRRPVGSWISVGTINILNPLLVIESIPLRHKEKYRADDVFKFDLVNDDSILFTTECRALLKVNEKFRLLRKQDSSFWGNRNEDFLIAAIVPGKDTANSWHLVASNLNASKDEEQKGKLVHKEDELSFTMMNLVLKEDNNPDAPEKNFSSLNRVYAFTYKDEIIAAVSVKEAGRKFWIKKGTDVKIRNVIAATAVILTIRQNFYR